MISLAIPTHDMKDKGFFLDRLMSSVETQTYRDFEIVMTSDGKMAENTNAAIKKCKGDIIKILYMDDYLAHPDSLKLIADSFKGGWLVTGCEHDDRQTRHSPHYPFWSPLLYTGMNSIGSPSVLAFENKEPLLFDEKMTWMLDVDLYIRIFERYGNPTILHDINVIIGVGDHQTTNLLREETKVKEKDYLIKKYE